ncbi:MAG: hypothetical protein IK105_06315 [Thermoguttaceae bacterium]|nr:hypothetical protein [Thermoguttaceae bacterium]
MVAKDGGISAFVEIIHDGVSKLRAFTSGLAASGQALARFASLLSNNGLQNAVGRAPRRFGIELQRVGRSIQRTATSSAGRAAGRFIGGTGRLATNIGRGIAGASTGATLAVGAGLAAAYVGFKAWSQHHQEMLENARKQATERSGIQSRAAQLNTKLNAELEKERIRDIYAIEQKRAENAKALHLMKATNVASELRYQREIFAIEERRFENEKKIAVLKTRANQIQQRTNLAFDELEKQGAARDSAHIVRRWWWTDKTVDANGNKIGNDLARSAMFSGLWHGRATTDANFAALQSIAANIRANIISGFREGSEIMSAKLSAALDKLNALGSDAYSEELRSEFNRVQTRVAVAQQQKANAMYAINYDEMMRMSEEEAIKAGKLQITADGKYEFYEVDWIFWTAKRLVS